MFFGKEEDFKKCPKCGYRFYTKPYPKVCPNPHCLHPLKTDDSFADHIEAKIYEKQTGLPAPETKKDLKAQKLPANIKNIEVIHTTASKKIKGVRVKKKKLNETIDLDSDIIVIPSKGLYFKNFGVVTDERKSVYNRNVIFGYIQELSFNLDYIASSILGGEIDRLILKSEVSNALEQVLYLKDNGLIYFIYGVFPNKMGSFLLKEMRKNLKGLLIGKDIKSLDRITLHNIDQKMNISIKYSLSNYLKMSGIITDKEIPPVDDWIRFDYFGMSYRSIGTISKVLGSDLPIEMDPNLPPAQAEDLKESLITAKIEAIAANTIANTNAVPKYLSVKLGYEHYRYIIFEKLQNDYFIYMLAEGNLEKAKPVVNHLVEIVKPASCNAFKGDLQPFIVLRDQILRFFNPSNAIDEKEGRIFK